MVKEKENSLAVGYPCRCSYWNSSSRRDYRACYGYWWVCVHFSPKYLLKCCAIFTGIPVWVGKKLFARYRNANRHKRNAAIVGGVIASVSGNANCLT